MGLARLRLLAAFTDMRQDFTLSIFCDCTQAASCACHQAH